MFVDRQDAAQQLAQKLLVHPLIRETSPTNLLVLSIPRGGVILGAVIAHELGCAHDVVIVKKIGFPSHQELAVGAMAEDGTAEFDLNTLRYYGLSKETLKPVIRETFAKIDRYVHTFRKGKALDVRGKWVILVDDGIATGETIKAAVRWVTRQQTQRAIIVAAPVCSPHTAAELQALVDELVCVAYPNDFIAVGQFYRHFEPVEDNEVLRVLNRRAIHS
jgi:predicted phosphoribosyltransferase